MARKSVLAIRGAFWSAINIIAPTAMSLLVFIITSRILTPSDFGVVALAAAIAAAAAAFTLSGFADALVQQGQKDHLVLSSVFWLCISAGVALYSVIVVIAPLFARLFHSSPLCVLLPVLGLKVISDSAAVVPNALVTQELSFHIIAKRTLIATAVSSAISIGLVLLGFGVWALVLSMLANSLVSTVAMFWSTRWVPKLSFSKTHIAHLANYGTYATGIKLLSFFASQGDQMIVGLLLGSRQLGFYYFARRIFNILNDVTSGALTAVAHPLFAGIRTDIARTRRGFITATFLSSAVAIPVFVGLGIVADRAVPLIFGNQWLGALWPLRILCAYGVISSVGILQMGLITSFGNANWWFYYQLFSSVLNIPIMLVLAPFGTTALLAGIVGKQYLIWPASIIMTLRLLSMDALSYLARFLSTLAASLIMSVAVITVRHLISSFGWPELIVEILVGSFTYLVALPMLARRDLNAVLLTLGAKEKFDRLKTSLQF